MSAGSSWTILLIDRSEPRCESQTWGKITELVRKSEWEKLNNYNIFDLYTSITLIDAGRGETVISNKL